MAFEFLTGRQENGILFLRNFKMNHFLALVVLAAATACLADARSRRAVGAMTLRATPRVAVQGITEEIRLDCRPAPTVKGVLMAVLIHLEKIDENGTTTLVASQRINTMVTGESNRTSAEGYLQADKIDKDSFLTAYIKDPILEDEGIYQCRFAFIDVALTVHTLGSKVNVTVSELPPPNYVPAAECDCDEIWNEINNLKAVRHEQPGQPAQHYDDKCRASFSANFKNRFGHKITSGATLAFDNIISNRGEAYNASTGVFKAPCDGQYYFTITLRTYQKSDSGHVDGVIVVDKQPKARTSVFIDSIVDNYQSASNGVVFSLKQGQEVKVIVDTTSSGEFVGAEFSVFSGFFLFP